MAVAEVLRDAVAVWRPVARARGRDLRLDWRPADAAVRGDRLRLAQACGNLLANAIEHGQGPVRVRGRAAIGPPAARRALRRAMPWRANGPHQPGRAAIAWISKRMPGATSPATTTLARLG